MTSRRQPVAALAAVTVALALAVPAASASAAPTAHAVRTTSIGPGLVAGPLTCRILVGRLRFAELSGNTLWANYVANVLLYSGCGGAAI
jgi:hypothetical protein